MEELPLDETTNSRLKTSQDVLYRGSSSGANTLTADDQTQSNPAEHASLASEETNPGEQLPGEEASATILDVEGNTESVNKREEPEGTEPLPAGEEESSELPSVWREESRGPSPPAPGEDAGAPSPGAAEDSGLAEGSDSSVVEVIEKVHITEEDHLTEGETGEQVETELLSETVSEGPETKEEETGEAVDSAAATEIDDGTALTQLREQLQARGGNNAENGIATI